MAGYASLTDKFNLRKLSYPDAEFEMVCGVAKYRLGKMFLRGEDVSENVDYALRWLEESSLESNEFAEYLLGKTYLKGEDVEQDLIRAEDLLWKSSAQGNNMPSIPSAKVYLTVICSCKIS